jgi:hypothetical protein
MHKKSARNSNLYYFCHSRKKLTAVSPFSIRHKMLRIEPRFAFINGVFNISLSATRSVCTTKVGVFLVWHKPPQIWLSQSAVYVLRSNKPFIWKLLTRLRGKTPPRLGHLAPASEVARGLILPFYNWQTITFLKWLGMFSCDLWGRR